MTDCSVNNNQTSGVEVCFDGCITIDGSATTIHHNVKSGNSVKNRVTNESEIKIKDLPDYIFNW